MKKKDQKLSRLKHELFQHRQKGKKMEVRRLSREEREYVEKFFSVEPWLYEIKLYFPPNYSPKRAGAPGVVKDLFYNYWRRHKTTVIRRLNEKELQECREAGMEPKEYKYKIFLK